MEVKPDPKLLTKQWLILTTVSVITVLSAAILHLIIFLVGDPPLNTYTIIWGITTAVLALMWAIAIPITILWIRNLSFRIADERITIFKGILTKSQQNIPYRAVTDFMLQRTLFDRYLGIGSICIQTAGQSHTATGYEGILSGLMDYDNLHRELRTRLKQLHPTSDSATAAESTAPEDGNTLIQILGELRSIRSLLEK